MTEPNWQANAREDREIWDRKAGFWDDYMGESNAFQRVLVNPAALELLQLKEGEQVLEFACGNGSFARVLASEGANVTATDFSQVFLERARTKSAEFVSRITYQLLDVTDRDALASLGKDHFDAAVCNMALMDIANIEILAEVLPSLLKLGGRFIFTVPHPAFNTNGVTKAIEEFDNQGKVEVIPTIKLRQYLTPGAELGTGVIGEPVPHRYYHRPMHMLIGTFTAHGLAMDGILEPAFPEGSSAKRPTSWDYFTDFPPVLAVRLRKFR